jgi:hypothetical protein
MYEDMSDFEINSKLYDLITGGSAAIIIPGYCGSWANMGPLIAKYGISITKANTDNAGCQWSADYVISWEDCVDKNDEAAFLLHHREDLSCMHTNPLRAAAICLIKLLESKQ